jgi:hypothetical protein
VLDAKRLTDRYCRTGHELEHQQGLYHHTEGSSSASCCGEEGWSGEGHQRESQLVNFLSSALTPRRRDRSVPSTVSTLRLWKHMHTRHPRQHCTSKFCITPTHARTEPNAQSLARARVPTRSRRNHRQHPRMRTLPVQDDEGDAREEQGFDPQWLAVGQDRNA